MSTASANAIPCIASHGPKNAGTARRLELDAHFGDDLLRGQQSLTLGGELQRTLEVVLGHAAEPVTFGVAGV